MRSALELFTALEGRSRRAELAAAFARAGGISPDDAARILWSVLTDLAADAAAAGAGPLAVLATAARDICEQATDLRLPEQRRDVLLLDDSEVTRDLVVMAIEAHGHAARVAEDVERFVAMFRARKPDIVLTEATVGGMPTAELCAVVRRATADPWVPVVMFAGDDARARADLAQHGIDRFVSKAQGVGGLIRELDDLLAEILW